MSHIFISYAHADREKLNRLVIKLNKSGFSEDEIWYDKHIKPGGDWRDEIEVKLKEAFTVIVIVTRKAMCSTYVTYEWSWAIGNGTPVIPLLFDDIPYTKIHGLLSKIHHLDCKTVIDEILIENIKNYQEMPPDTIYLNRLMVKKILPFRVLARILLWMYPYCLIEGLVDQTMFEDLRETLRDARYKLSQYLLELIVDKSHAFTSRQIRTTRTLIQLIDKFRDIFYQRSDINPNWDLAYPLNNEVINKAEEWRIKQFEPIMTGFESTDPNIDLSYQKLDYYLRKISEKFIPASGVVIMPPNEWLMSAQFDPILDTFESEEKANHVIETIQRILASQN